VRYTAFSLPVVVEPSNKESDMSASATVNVGVNTRFKAGWIALLATAALMTLMHAGLIFALGEPVLFIGYAAFNLYSLLVIAIPFRRLERWAWYATWILPVGLVLPAALDPGLLLFYAVFAGACVLGLVLTSREFFTLDRSVSSRAS
jgi:hypothetical protein